jgi:hypothetical protein
MSHSHAAPGADRALPSTSGGCTHLQFEAVFTASRESANRVLRVCGKGGKVVLVPLPPAVGRAIDRAVGDRDCGPILLNSRGVRMDVAIASDAYGIRYMAGLYEIEIEPEVRSWLAGLSDRDFGRVDFLVGPARRARRRSRLALHPPSRREDQGAAVPPITPADPGRLLARHRSPGIRPGGELT